MKTMIMLMFSTVLFLGSNGQVKSQPLQVTPAPEVPVKVNGPVAKWDKTAEEMGDILQGVPRIAEFKLSNEGNEPLLIASAKASCGCTNLNYSKEPLLPGKSTTLTVTYNAAAKGPFIKTVTVTTNAGAQATALQIKGNVLEKLTGQKE
jgi:Protein of unknown function (DUF1573)